MSIKTSNTLYGIAIIVVIGVLLGFVSYTFPIQTPGQQAHVNGNTAEVVTFPAKTTVTITTVSTPKTDNCGCCAERRVRLQRQKQQAREREQKRQQIAGVNAQTSKN